YLLAFANINYPHEYYQLVITPFLAIVAAKGVVWLVKKIHPPTLDYSVVNQSMFALAVSVWVIAAVANYVLWFKWPLIDNRIVAFEKLCAGKVEPWAPAILFSTTEETGSNPSHQFPGYLYAGKLWGYSCIVPDAGSARESFERISRGFERLQYVVFYGTEQ